ncbi:hypothetical protein ACFVYE_44015 [Streptomyces sp. NPDC058239]
MHEHHQKHGQPDPVGRPAVQDYDPLATGRRGKKSEELTKHGTT